MSSYGDAGKAYIDWCANMAVSQDIGVPWIMCQQSDAPQPMVKNRIFIWNLAISEDLLFSKLDFDQNISF